MELVGGKRPRSLKFASLRVFAKVGERFIPSIRAVLRVGMEMFFPVRGL